MFSTWDIVRPRYWHPMASLEQSMMDMDRMADLMLERQPYARSPFRLGDDEMMLAAPPIAEEEDEFFNDLPVRGRQETKPSQAGSATDTTTQQQPQQSTEQTPEGQQGDNIGRTFSTYSFSNSSIMDDKGRRVVSTRRRYEDSTGRLKAVHERQIEDKKLRAVWNRMHKDDTGAHDQICENGTPEEFEAAWKQTPFGEAQEQKMIKDKGEAADKKEPSAAKTS
jgi:hypothetical protein